MKIPVILVLLTFAGCQSAPPSVAPPLRPPPEVRPVPGETSSVSALERKLRQQAQYLDALLSQNDALTARLAEAGPRTAPVLATPALPPPLAIAGPTPVAAEPALSPNAEGVIDLTAVTVKPGAAVNPFAVRAPGDARGRELSLHVSGIIAGPVACAVINERLLVVGDTVESFRVERIEADAVALRLGDQRLRLPVADKPVRVRLPQ